MNKTENNPHLEPISEDISFSRKKSTYNASYAYHRHDGCEVYLFLSGNVRLYIEQTCFSPVPGSLVILNSNEMHRVQSIDQSPYERIVINIKRDYMEALSPCDFSLEDCFYTRPLGTENLRVLSPDALQEFLTLYKGLESSATPNCFGRTIIQNAYASLLLLFLNRQYQTGPSSYKNTMPAYITGTMQYIDSHLNEPIRLSVLANNFHISESYLSAQFKHHTGLTLRAYLLDRKISCAKQLLQEGVSVTDACYCSGFNDYANFIRSFKNATGVSPGKYHESIS
ncbi:MAG: helix-turn-helix transcriptional regulator [Lachnospiraceae bacterium]|nr:helix-turn-helix transcriptional regulator [Lachnospiraceae bacterium]